MTVPSPAALTVPTGSANRAAMATGTSAQRRRPAPSAATIASISAKVRNVRCVPTSGISSRAERNVPTSEPTVEIAYIRPAVCPESSIRWSLSRIAHGDTAPSISTGTATSTSTPNSEPANAPTRVLVERLDAEREERVGDDRHEREQRRRHQHQHAQRALIGAAIGHPAAEPVADRQRHQHDRDRVRPHDRRGAEERRHQPRRGDLRAQRRGADDEHEQLEWRERPSGAPIDARACRGLSPRRG